MYKRQVVAKLEVDGKIVMEIGGENVEITDEMVDVKISAKDGFAVAMENNVFTILDTTVCLLYTSIDLSLATRRLFVDKEITGEPDYRPQLYKKFL